jgi:hypothetical protein
MNQTPQTDSFEVLCPLFLSMPYIPSFFIKKLCLISIMGSSFFNLLVEAFSHFFLIIHQSHCSLLIHSSTEDNYTFIH